MRGACAVQAASLALVGLACGRSQLSTLSPRGPGPDAAPPSIEAGTPAPDSQARGSGQDATADDVMIQSSATADAALSDGFESATDSAESRGYHHYTALALATGEGHVCALMDNRRIKCWGTNDEGELGYGDTRARGANSSDMGDALPVVDLGTDRTAIAIAAGQAATCAILDNGTAKCWGLPMLNGSGATKPIGTNPADMGDDLLPLDFGGRRPVQVAMGHYYAFALMDDQTIWSWGGSAPSAPAPIDLGTLKPVKDMSVTDQGLAVLYQDGTLGYEMRGKSYLDALTQSHVRTISGAYSSDTCAIYDDGTNECVSGPAKDQIPLPTTTVSLGTMTDGEICALLADGSVQCLGVPCPYATSFVCNGVCPTPMTYWCSTNNPTIPLGQAATAVTSGGSAFSCALLVSGDIKCWGGSPVLPPPVWSGAEIGYSQMGGTLTYGPWNPIDLGSGP